jgi:hypothetical protein
LKAAHSNTPSQLRADRRKAMETQALLDRFGDLAKSARRWASKAWRPEFLAVANLCLSNFSRTNAALVPARFLL